MTSRLILLGYLLLSALAFADVFTYAHGQGHAVLRDVAGARAAAGHETALSPSPAASPSTTKEIVAFPAGEHYYLSAFAYKITNTMRIRLVRTPSAQLIVACLAQYRGEFQGPRHPSVQEAAITTRTWINHQGTIYQAVELLLDAQVQKSAEHSVPYILSCPLNEDDSLDVTSMNAYLTAFRQGMAIK